MTMCIKWGVLTKGMKNWQERLDHISIKPSINKFSGEPKMCYDR